jgi:C-terminal region of eIF3h
MVSTAAALFQLLHPIQAMAEMGVHAAMQENAARRAAGEEPLPEEEPGLFKPLPEPSQLDNVLLANQMDACVLWFRPVAYTICRLTLDSWCAGRAPPCRVLWPLEGDLKLDPELKFPPSPISRMGLLPWSLADHSVFFGCSYTDAVNSIGGAGLQKLFLLNSLQQTAGT